MTISKEEYDQLSEEEKKAYIESTFLSNKVSKRQPWITRGLPQNFKQFFAGLLGLPIEKWARKINHPFVLWSFVGILFFIHYWASTYGLESIINTWGFIPQQFYRHSFLTFFTSFFLHGGWLHLLGNCYYFYIFGDDVEDDLGPKNFVMLLFGGHLFGILLNGLLAGSPHLPIVGASAGISAILGYYMVRFPKRQITYMLFVFYVWLNVPASIAFLWKFGWEFLVASSSIGIQSGVAHWAHLGGALLGAFVAIKFKDNLKTA